VTGLGDKLSGMPAPGGMIPSACPAAAGPRSWLVSRDRVVGSIARHWAVLCKFTLERVAL